MPEWMIRLLNGEEIPADAYLVNGDKFLYLPRGKRTWEAIDSGRVERIDRARASSGSEEDANVVQFRSRRRK